MNNIFLGKGKLTGKGVYAARDFAKGELVMSYNLKELSQVDFSALPKSEHMFTHSFYGKVYLYPEPARYVNHSADPNTQQDISRMCDFATRPIKKGEMITTNATKEIENEIQTFIENKEQATPKSISWLKKGYRNTECVFEVKGVKKKLVLKRIDGNWSVIKEEIVS